MNQEFFSVLVQVVAALGLAGIILLLSILMGKRSSVRKPADIPYECGMIPMGGRRSHVLREILHGGHALRHF